MRQRRHIARTCIFVSLFGSIVFGCGASGDEPLQSSSARLLDGLPLPVPGVPMPGHCLLSRPKDVLIAELVKDSWRVGYPLTRLSVSADGAITGVNLPPSIAGQLEVINTVEAARASVARAVVEYAGLPDYGMSGSGLELPSCLAVPAWTPSGTTRVATTARQVFPNSVNPASWRRVHLAFSRECPLVRSLLNADVVDPPGDGSTNAPVSETVSASGVTANAYGLCSPSAPSGTFCKLSYAMGARWTGRSCQYYYGNQRCLLH